MKKLISLSGLFLICIAAFAQNAAPNGRYYLVDCEVRIHDSVQVIGYVGYEKAGGVANIQEVKRYIGLISGGKDIKIISIAAICRTEYNGFFAGKTRRLIPTKVTLPKIEARPLITFNANN